MRHRQALVWLLLCVFWAACGKTGAPESAKPGQSGEAEGETARTAADGPGPSDEPRITAVLDLVPTTYSDGREWKSGINIQTGKMFYFTVPKDDRIPIAAGCRLRFAGAGMAVVQTVSSMVNHDTSTRSVFVTVDKPLDPGRDGAPNRVHIVSYRTTAADYTQAGDYLNGMHVAKPGVFFAVVQATDPFPIAPGARLRFAATGDTLVLSVTTQTSEMPGYLVHHVTVDHPLDPARDGFPNPVELFVSK